jgi:Fe2+ or Zn2+ uptake regulation protein
MAVKRRQKERNIHGDKNGIRKVYSQGKKPSGMVILNITLLQIVAIRKPMTCSADYAPQLRARGYRMTPQRMAILHVIYHSGKHLSPSVIYEKARKELPGITETTVYRTLEFLAQNGLVRSAHMGNGHLVYEIAGHEHHHLKCRACGSEMEVEHSLLETLYRQLESASGYQLTDSHLTFFGLCPNCQKGE